MKQYIEANKDRFLEELFSLIRIPSISSEQEQSPTWCVAPNAGVSYCLKLAPTAPK